MTLVFWLIAGVMALAAVALVLRPLLRGDAAVDPRLAALERARRDGVLSEAEYEAKRASLGVASAAPAVPKATAVALAALLLAGSFLGYRLVGDPAGLDPSAVPRSTPAAMPLEQATEGLAAKLADEGGSADQWLMLGRSYKELQRFAPAREALAKAYELAPSDPDVLVEYAESLALAADDRRLDGEALALLARALELDPAHQRGLWLRGIASLQAERYADAVADWERLLAQLPADSSVAESVREQIAQARARAGMPALAERVAPVASATAAVPDADAGARPAPEAGAAAGPHLVVEVGLAPELAGKVAAGDTLFVFARAPQGSKMPLAIQRLPVPQFPATIVLDDTMGMMPALKLSQAGEVVIGARISKSGNAAALSGDLEIISGPVTVATQRGPVKLVIDRVVP